MPLRNRLGPLLRHLLQAPIPPWDDRLGMWERPAPLPHFPPRLVSRLAGLRRLARPPDRWRIITDPRPPLPGGPPARTAGEGLGVPAVGAARQGLLRRRTGQRPRERPPGGRPGAALVPGPILETVPPLLPHAERHLGLRTPRLARLRPPWEAVDARPQAVLHAAVLQRGTAREPHWRPLALTQPPPQACLRAVPGDAPREGHRWGLPRPRLPGFAPPRRTREERGCRGARPGLPGAHVLPHRGRAG